MTFNHSWNDVTECAQTIVPFVYIAVRAIVQHAKPFRYKSEVSQPSDEFTCATTLALNYFYYPKIVNIRFSIPWLFTLYSLMC